MLHNFHGRHPQVAALIGFHGTQVLNGMHALQAGLRHRRGDHRHAAVLGVVDSQFSDISLVADYPAQLDIIENLLNRRDKVGQLKVVIVGKFVVAGFFKLGLLKANPSLHQLAMYCHIISFSILFASSLWARH